MIPTLLIASQLLAAAVNESAEPAAPRHEKPTGVGSFGVEFIDSIHGAGLVKLNGTSVSALRVDGSLVSKDAKIGSITIHGEANLRDTSISGAGSVIGSIQAHSSQFLELLTLCTPKAVFTHSQLHSLAVRQEAGFKGRQVIELKQGTKVNGPIHFDSGKGEVHIDPTSKVAGPVTGGKVIHKGS